MSNDDDDWKRLEGLALSDDPVNRRTAVAEAATRTEGLLRGFGYLTRLGSSTLDDVPEKLGDALRLLVNAIPLKELDTKLRLAREIRNKIAHEAEEIKPVDALQVVSTLHEFCDEVSKWVKNAQHPSIEEVRRRAGKYEKRPSYRSRPSSQVAAAEFEPEPDSIRRVEAGPPVLEIPAPEPPQPTPADDVRSLVATITSLWDLVSPAREFLARHADAATRKLSESKGPIGRAATLVVGGYLALTVLALIVGSLGPWIVTEALARTLAFIALVGIVLFGVLIVAAITMLSQVAHDVIQIPRRFLLNAISGIARTQAAQELVQVAHAPLAPQRWAEQAIEVLPKYLVASITLPFSVWAAWVFCLPYWSVAPYGIALTLVSTLLFVHAAREGTRWEQTVKTANAFVMTAGVMGIMLALVAFKFPEFGTATRGLVDGFGAFTRNHLGQAGSLFDLGQASAWRTTPLAQAERAVVVGSFAWGLALVPAMVFHAATAGAGAAQTLRGFLGLTGFLLGVGWLGMLGFRIVGPAQADTEVDGLSEKQTHGAEIEAKHNKPPTASTERDATTMGAPLAQAAPTSWQASLFLPTCDAPCSAGDMCALNPKKCASGITCVPGDNAELLKAEEAWNLHLSSVSLPGPDETRIHGCKTARDLWLCRRGSTECLSQRDACTHVRIAATSAASIPITGDHILRGDLVFEVREGGPTGTTIATTTSVPTDLKRRGLCSGYKVDTIDARSGERGMAWFFLLPK